MDFLEDVGVRLWIEYKIYDPHFEWFDVWVSAQHELRTSLGSAVGWEEHGFFNIFAVSPHDISSQCFDEVVNIESNMVLVWC